jgi:hypothetical protein
LNRRPRRQDLLDDSESPFSKRNDSRNPLALKAYRLSILGLIPLVGLVLGPIAIVLALLAWRPVRRESPRKSGGLVVAALLVGLATSVANGIGVALMVYGLTASGGP